MPREVLEGTPPTFYIHVTNTTLKAGKLGGMSTLLVRWLTG